MGPCSNEIISVFWQNLSESFAKIELHLFKGSIWLKYFTAEFFLMLYRTFSRKLSLFLRIFCCTIVLIAFHLSRGIFQSGLFWKKKTNSLGGCLKNLRLLSFCQTISGGFCRNYTLHVRSNISQKTVFFWKKHFLRDFDNKRRYCGSVVESFSLRFKKL